MSLIKPVATLATLTTLVGLTAVPSHAASFGTSGIFFEEDTKVTFEFIESFGKFSSDFGVVEVDEFGELVAGTESILIQEEARGYDVDADGRQIGDFIGTVGETVLDPVTSFIFEGGKTYSLFLDSFGSGATNRGARRSNSPVYSTTALNTDFDSILGPDTQAIFEGDIFADSTVLRWDDRGNQNDIDFNDFFVKATLDEKESIPEPFALMGLSIVTAGMLITRRQKQG